MSKQLSFGNPICGSPSDANGIKYNNTNSGITSTSVQGAIDTVNTKVNNAMGAIDTVNTKVNNAMGAIDTVNTKVNNAMGVTDAFDVTKTYTKGAYCIYNNVIYCAIVDTVPTGTLPTNTTYWESMSISQLNNSLSESLPHRVIPTYTILTNTVPSNKSKVALASFSVSESGYYIMKFYYRAIVPSGYRIIFLPFSQSTATYELGAFGNSYIFTPNGYGVTNTSLCDSLTAGYTYYLLAESTYTSDIVLADMGKVFIKLY